MLRSCCLITALTTLTASTAAVADDDILIADFDGQDYGDWKPSGEAFGAGPAEGTLSGQMHVSGFRGKRLVNSFYQGDRTTGTLTSPSLKIERDYITFLIGGGGHKGKTCINLLLDGEVVRTATGTNTRSGGSEELAPHFWDVSKFRGKRVTIQVVDQATGGWGHINVDHIVQSNTKPRLPDLQPRGREFTVRDKYLVVPIKNGAKSCQITLDVDGMPVRRYGTELATAADSVDWYAYFTIESYKGKTAKLTVDRATEEGFGRIQQSNEIPGSDSFYTEPLRPQLRFSQRVGWNNDPNGMVYHDGEWHLYFQHNPVGWKWGNMTWGHAVSMDLIYWQQLPNVLFPETTARGACFSGGAVIDEPNTAGFKSGEEDVLVAFLTDTGAGETVAYSNDRGRTFTWYDKNPVIKHKGRDPKVIWYPYDVDDTPLTDKAQELGGHWVMVLYDEHEKLGRNLAFYTSTDLKHWEKQSHLPGYFECPELFELPLDGDAENKRWVVFAADARYATGEFDGKAFTPEHEGKHRVHYGSYYASQIFSNAPDQRQIQIGWARVAMPGMPFNQTFSLPTELTLKSTADGARLCAQPVKELETLRGKPLTADRRLLSPDNPIRFETGGQLYDVVIEVEPRDAKQIVLQFGGERVGYDVAAAKLDEMPLPLANGKLKLRLVVDRPMYELCGGDGDVYKTAPRSEPGKPIGAIQLSAVGGEARIETLKIYPMKSIWSK